MSRPIAFRLPALLLLAGVAAPAVGQPPVEVPKNFPPDAATLERIEGKRKELRAAIDALPKKTLEDAGADIEVYAKAAEWTVRHGEWYSKNAAGQTLTVLDAGLARAKAAAEGKTPWRDIRGRPVVRGYRSFVDSSVQPYRVTLPTEGAKDDPPVRLDVVLHGRDQTLTEVKFMAAAETAKPAAKPSGVTVVEPYGRGNNGYRWAGERDVEDAATQGYFTEVSRLGGKFTAYPRALRGFSMGGAGAWHIGLHHPFEYDAVAPGAGFVTTRGYVRNLPASPPDYQTKCLHIYDAVDYAENAFNVPVVAYSGGIDPQKAAADGIAVALKGFSLPLRFQHFVAPGLGHQMPPDWQAKVDAELRRYAIPERPTPERFRFVTYTTRYNRFGCGEIISLDRHYEKAVVDVTWTADRLTVGTTNVKRLLLEKQTQSYPDFLTIDGQKLPCYEAGEPKNIQGRIRWLEKRPGGWVLLRRWDPDGRSKYRGLQGPIDDAFDSRFVVVGPTGEGWSGPTGRHTAGSLERFAVEWDKYFRGRLPVKPVAGAKASAEENSRSDNWVLFGDPQSNQLIAEVLPRLPITWTKEKLIVNGVAYDTKSHIPVLIYPNPFAPYQYVVINSGHTFHAKEFQGSNALLYPRLGDWAVLKVAPTDQDPAAAEVVAGGLFDEFWQFPK